MYVIDASVYSCRLRTGEIHDRASARLFEVMAARRTAILCPRSCFQRWKLLWRVAWVMRNSRIALRVTYRNCQVIDSSRLARNSVGFQLGRRLSAILEASMQYTLPWRDGKGYRWSPGTTNSGAEQRR